MPALVWIGGRTWGLLVGLAAGMGGRRYHGDGGGSMGVGDGWMMKLPQEERRKSGGALAADLIKVLHMPRTSPSPKKGVIRAYSGLSSGGIRS